MKKKESDREEEEGVGGREGEERMEGRGGRKREEGKKKKTQAASGNLS